MRGELSLDDMSGNPTYVDDWPLKRKKEEFIKWLTSNYTLDESFYYDFSDWENGDELEDHTELYGETTETILKKVWGHLLIAHEFNALVKLLDVEFQDEWKPSEDRINIEELDDDDDRVPFVTLGDVQAELPRIIETLKVLSDVIPAGIGHNQAPSNHLDVSLSDVSTLERLLKDAQNLNNNTLSAQQSLLKQIGEWCIKIARASIEYAKHRADLFVTEYVKASGNSLGKWTPAGLGLLLASGTVSEFGQKIIDFALK